MRLPFIQCDDYPGGLAVFIAPEAVQRIIATTTVVEQHYRLTFYGENMVDPLGSKTLMNIKTEPEVRDWIDYYIRGNRGNDKA